MLHQQMASFSPNAMQIVGICATLIHGSSTRSFHANNMRSTSGSQIEASVTAAQRMEGQRAVPRAAAQHHSLGASTDRAQAAPAVRAHTGHALDHVQVWTSPRSHIWCPHRTHLRICLCQFLSTSHAGATSEQMITPLEHRLPRKQLLC